MPRNRFAAAGHESHVHPAARENLALGLHVGLDAVPLRQDIAAVDGQDVEAGRGVDMRQIIAGHFGARQHRVWLVGRAGFERGELHRRAGVNLAMFVDVMVLDVAFLDVGRNAGLNDRRHRGRDIRRNGSSDRPGRGFISVGVFGCRCTHGLSRAGRCCHATRRRIHRNRRGGQVRIRDRAGLDAGGGRHDDKECGNAPRRDTQQHFDVPERRDETLARALPAFCSGTA